MHRQSVPERLPKGSLMTERLSGATGLGGDQFIDREALKGLSPRMKRPVPDRTPAREELPTNKEESLPCWAAASKWPMPEEIAEELLAMGCLRHANRLVGMAITCSPQGRAITSTETMIGGGAGRNL